MSVPLLLIVGASLHPSDPTYLAGCLLHSQLLKMLSLFTLGSGVPNQAAPQHSNSIFEWLTFPICLDTTPYTGFFILSKESLPYSVLVSRSWIGLFKKWRKEGKIEVLTEYINYIFFPLLKISRKYIHCDFNLFQIIYK